MLFIGNKSYVDPIKYNISFARFINSYRDNLPDIDFDFPHYLRDEVFLKLFQKWGHCVARISNHNYYHEKSALRESLRSLVLINLFQNMISKKVKLIHMIKIYKMIYIVHKRILKVNLEVIHCIVVE